MKTNFSLMCLITLIMFCFISYLSIIITCTILGPDDMNLH